MHSSFIILLEIIIQIYYQHTYIYVRMHMYVLCIYICTHICTCTSDNYVFCVTSEKDSEKSANPTSRYLYDCLLVAIALLCFLCKSYAVTVRHRKVMWHWIFQISISQCAHMVNFPGRVTYVSVQNRYTCQLLYCKQSHTTCYIDTSAHTCTLFPVNYKPIRGMLPHIW